MSKMTAFAVFCLAGAVLVFGWVFYKSSQSAAQSLQTTAQGTGNINKLAGQISDVLDSLGVKSGS